MTRTWTANAGRALPCLFLAVCLGAGCQQPSGQGPGHRQQRLGLTPEQEYELGEKAYREILSKSEIVRRGPEVEQVQRVGRRIARAAENKDLQREINLHLEGYRFDWEFNVIRSPQVNAFCLPGGKIAVFTGLFRLIGDSDDMLAAVLGHEVAHALAHHANERITRQALHEHAIRVITGAFGGRDNEQHRRLMAILMGGSRFYDLHYDRQQESEADHIGIFLMTFAGYNPAAAITFWERMAEVSRSRGHPPEILSDHPSDASRLAHIRVWVTQAEAAKKAYDEGRIAPARR
jgi:predicted Zn-dependent protease